MTLHLLFKLSIALSENTSRLRGTTFRSNTTSKESTSFKFYSAKRIAIKKQVVEKKSIALAAFLIMPWLSQKRKIW